jgi:hypothetical protein
VGTWLQSLTFMHDRKCTPKHVLPLHEKMSLTRAHADARDRLEQRDNLKSWRSEWGEGGGRSAHTSQIPGNPLGTTESLDFSIRKLSTTKHCRSKPLRHVTRMVSLGSTLKFRLRVRDEIEQGTPISRERISR